MEMLNNIQNGTYKRLGKNAGIVNAVESSQNKNIGRVQILEDAKNIVISEIITQREHFLSQYSHFAVKTAKSTVEMCRVVQEAKINLSKDEFLAFCADIGHKGEDSTIRKYITIGRLYEKLIQYTNLLPSCWTNIYEITQLSSDTFDALAASDTDMSKMNGKQIKSLVNSCKPKLSFNAASTADATAELPTAEMPSDEQPIDAAASETSSPEQVDEIAQDKSAGMTAEEAPVASPEQASTKATTCQVEVEDVFEPYKVLIYFNSKPSDEATLYLFDCINNLKSNFHVDIAIKGPEF